MRLEVDSGSMKLKFRGLLSPNAQIAAVFSTLLTLIAIGTVCYRYLEEWSWIDSFYFTVCTVTTVGYGDLVPSSDVSRLFTALYALAGVSLALASLGIVGTSYLTGRQERVLRSMEARRSQKSSKTEAELADQD
jgi:voltage-gated potassium channel